MQLTNFISRRFISGDKRRKRFSPNLITLLTIICLALSVTAIITTLAVVDGFHQDLTNRIFLLNEHIRIQKDDGISRAEYKGIDSLLAEITEIENYYLCGKTEVIASAKNGTTGAVLFGIEGNNAKIFQFFFNELKTIEKGQLVIGIDLKQITSYTSPGSISITSPSIKKYSHFGAIPKTKSFEAADYFFTGIKEYDSYFCLVNLDDFNKFTEGREQNYINVRVKDPVKAALVAAEIKEKLGKDFRVEDWSTFDKNLYSAIKLEKNIMFAVIMLMFIIASFNIFGILTKMVSERRKDIAILEAIGLPVATARRIFLVMGIRIGTIGISAGLIMSVILLLLQRNFGILSIPHRGLPFSHVPVSISIPNILLITACCFVIIVIASLLPIRKAGNVSISRILKEGQ